MTEKPIILVVEDENLLMKTIKAKLERSGFTPVGFDNGQAAMEYLKGVSELPSVLWLDYYLKGDKTGLDLMHELKKDERLNSIPVIIVSNTATEDKISEMMALGAKRYFTKAKYLLSEITDYLWTLVKT